jgi:glycosyltransferase involved in cell wall biosynthesis
MPLGYPAAVSNDGKCSSSVPSRRLLVITQFYPPAQHVGALRWAAMAKYLRRMGHEITVIAGDAWPTGADSNGVVWTRDLVGHPGLRRLLRRPPLPGVGNGRPSVQRNPSVAARLFVPDVTVAAWMPSALRAARRILAARRIDCVITTSPPESVHLVGLALGRSRPAWVADFREGWTFECGRHPFGTVAQRALNDWLESQVVRRADRVMAATAPIAEDLASRFGVDARHVTNGWDPERLSIVERGRDRRSDRVTLVHTGRLSGPLGRDPRPLFDGLHSMFESRPDLRKRVRIVLAGSLYAHEDELIRRSGLADVIQTPGHLQPDEALALQRQADALVLLTSRDASEATGKLFEYLGAGRPILALAGNNAAAKIVRETRAGVVVSPTDQAALVDALVAVAEGRLSYEPRDDLIERYFFPAPAILVAGEIEKAIARRDGAKRGLPQAEAPLEPAAGLDPAPA